MSKKSNRVWRGPSPTANRLLLRLPPLVVPRSPIYQFDDRRFFHPEGMSRPALSFFRPAARLVAKAPAVSRSGSRPSWPGSGIRFAIPEKVAICVRRNVRAEVLHAKGVAGSKRVKRGKHNAYSSISCKR